MTRTSQRYDGRRWWLPDVAVEAIRALKPMLHKGGATQVLATLSIVAIVAIVAASPAALLFLVQSIGS